MHSLRADVQRGRDLGPRPPRGAGSCHLVLLAHLRDLPQGEHTDKADLGIFVGGQTDNSEPALS